MKIAAVIVTHNNQATLKECIKSVRSSGVTEIIVVDNASSDATLHVASALNVPYLAQPKNEGFATAANKGARRITNDYILFLNPDATLAPGALERIRRYVAAHPQVGIAGLALYNPQNSVEENACGALPTLWSLITRNLVSHQLPAKPAQMGWVSAAAIVVNRNAFQAVAGFDLRFFLYWEDVDLCRRMQQVGWQVVLVPDARALHKRGHSLADRRRKTTLYDASADKYFCKHYSGVVCHLQRFLRSLYRLYSPLAQ